jgi:hypothetical protein
MARPSTPDPVARQLRQEAGFGCCVCGNPILQYHHIVEWAAEPHFRVADMMVLCPLHHDQATKKAMPEDEQRKFKARPRNIVAGLAKGLLAVRQDYCAADFGSITVVGDGTFLRIGGEDIVGFHLEDGNIQISLRLYSESDELLLRIDRNEWLSGDPLPWDIDADWQILTLRERARRVTLSLKAKAVPLEVTGSFYRYGQRVSISNGGIQVGNKSASAGLHELALVGMALEVQATGTGFGVKPTSNDPFGMIVSWPNRRERLWKAKDAWKKIEANRSNVVNV